MIKRMMKHSLHPGIWRLLVGLNRSVESVFTQSVLWLIRVLPNRVGIGIKERLDIVVKMDYLRRDVLLNIASGIEYDTRVRSSAKEPETVAWIETFLKEDDVFYDVGANIGAYSLMAAKYHNSNIKVYAFEPGFSNFPQLVKNIVLNGCEESIIPLQVALSNKTIVGTFNYSNLVSGAALHALGKAIDELGRPFKPILRQPVLAYRVDDLVKQFRIPVPNHIKIDVDGAELAVLEGAEETLADSSVKSIIVEVAEGAEKTAHLVELLVGKGFQLLSRCEDVYGNGNGSGAKVLNYIFQRVLVSTDRAHPAMRL